MQQQTQGLELVAEKRTMVGKQVKKLRREGWVPAIMYGHDSEPIPLQLEERALALAIEQARGVQLIGIKIKGENQSELAILREVQRDPIQRSLLHVDFQRVKMTERIRAEVPLELVGESPIIESKAGILLHGISSIEVECLPKDLVGVIEVDISGLTALDQAIYVRDLVAPTGVEILTDPDEMIVRVAPLEEEEIEEEAPEVMEVEIIRESKRKEREEE
jgi:large subunit ribosomal protein L25